MLPFQAMQMRKIRKWTVLVTLLRPSTLYGKHVCQILCIWHLLFWCKSLENGKYHNTFNKTGWPYCLCKWGQSRKLNVLAPLHYLVLSMGNVYAKFCAYHSNSFSVWALIMSTIVISTSMMSYANEWIPEVETRHRCSSVKAWLHKIIHVWYGCHTKYSLVDRSM